MKSREGVLRLNVRGAGESFVWAGSRPLLTPDVVQDYLPRTDDNLFGPNLSFTSVLLAPDTFFIATLSRWYRPDAFNRKGLSLAQGELVRVDPSDPESYFHVCERFLAISHFHKASYAPLGEMLETLATEGDEADARKFAEAGANCPSPAIDSGTAAHLRNMVTVLRKESGPSNVPLRIYLDFPAPPELAPCALIGLQAGLPGVTKVGGGSFDRFDGLHHLVSPEEVREYHFVDLSAAFAPTRPGEPPPPVQPQNNSKEASAPRAVPARAGRPLLVPALLILALSLGAFCFWFLKEQIEQQKLLTLQLIAANQALVKAIAAIPAAIPATGGPVTAVTAETPVGEPGSADLIRSLFSQAKPVREQAFQELEKSWASDAEAIDALLSQAEAQKTHRSGIYLTLRLLEQTDARLLDQRRERLKPFLDTVRVNGPSTRKLAQKLLDRLQEPHKD